MKLQPLLPYTDCCAQSMHVQPLVPWLKSVLVQGASEQTSPDGAAQKCMQRQHK